MRIEAGRPKTKIVCTLGPATSTEETVRSLAESGMSIARLNLSHGTMAEHTESLRIVRKVSADIDLPLGIMVDVPGIKSRTGPTDPGVVNLSEGDDFTLTSRDVVGNERLVSISPPGIHRDADPGSPVLLDDGLMELSVVAVKGEDVTCTVVRGGRLTEGRGRSYPGKVPVSRLSEREGHRSAGVCGGVQGGLRCAVHHHRARRHRRCQGRPGEEGAQSFHHLENRAFRRGR